MPNAFEARLRKLEARADQTSRKFIVVANEAERAALTRAGGIPARAVVIITGGYHDLTVDVPSRTLRDCSSAAPERLLASRYEPCGRTLAPFRHYAAAT